MTITIDDIRDAAERLASKAVLTPLLESPLLNERLGCRILVKAENLQLTGTFKFRGAYNRVSRLDTAGLAHGVCAYSSGNHAQGVAAAARVCGTSSLIVVPKDTPAIKIENTKAWGAELAYYDRETDDRVAITEKLAAERGMALVPPFDHEEVIAGQGTIGIEIVEQFAASGISADAVVIPCGGGGLSAGISTAVKALSPATYIFLAEPAAFDDTRRSLASGERVAIDPRTAHTICDALAAPTPGEITFAINRRLASGSVALSDDDVCRGLYTAFRDLKIVLEPSGAIALAAVVTGVLTAQAAFAIKGRTIVVVASGGNVDGPAYAEALKKGAPT